MSMGSTHVFPICAIAAMPSPADFLSVQCVCFLWYSHRLLLRLHSKVIQFPNKSLYYSSVCSYAVTMCSGSPHQQVNDHATLNNYSQTADYSLWNDDTHIIVQQWPSGSIDDANIWHSPSMNINFQCMTRTVTSPLRYEETRLLSQESRNFSAL